MSTKTKAPRGDSKTKAPKGKPGAAARTARAKPKPVAPRGPKPVEHQPRLPGVRLLSGEEMRAAIEGRERRPLPKAWVCCREDQMADYSEVAGDRVRDVVAEQIWHWGGEDNPDVAVWRE